ncbi:hypothetical protein HDU97_000250 [Phlyctochytrium planicorne]|nr:hypothetical protein HDU97_000250 [Phlyctochytrium planicorne]
MVQIISKLIALSLALVATVQAAPTTAASDDFRQQFKKPDGYDKVMAEHMKKIDAVRNRMGDISRAQPAAQQYFSEIAAMEAQLPEMITSIFGPNGPGAGRPDVVQAQIVKPVLERRGGSPKVVQGTGPSSQLDKLKLWSAFSSASYCSLDAMKAWSCKACQTTAAGNTNVTTFSNDGTGMQGYVGYNAGLNTIVVAFRGSSNIQNWIQNLAFFRVDIEVRNAPSGVSVHFGFQNTWDSVSDTVIPAVTNLARTYPNAALTVVGHSLGGAVATMGAINLAQVVPANKIRLYTQGSPRVGNEAFYSYVRNFGFQEVLRGVNYNDLVPHLPPTPLGFNHVNAEHWIDSTGRTDVCDDVDPARKGEDTNCANSTFPWYSTAPHTTYFGSDMGGASC